MDYSFLLKTQPKLVKLFNNGFKKNRLSQVYLLDGVKGTPKTQAAMYFANMLLCDTHDFCGKCINCKRISENVHPRIMVIEPDAQGAIKKDVIEVHNDEDLYNWLKKLDMDMVGTIKVILTDGTETYTSRRNVTNLKKKLGISYKEIKNKKTTI